MRTNLFITSLVVLIVITMLTIVSCQEEKEVVPATISLSEEVVSLVVGSEKALTATATPQVSNQEIVWFSNKTHVVTVSGGVIKAVGEGNAKVVAQTGNSTAICEVIVTKVAVPVTGISLNNTELEMRAGDVERLIATLEPYDATNRKINWSSSNENIVSIQQNGTLTAHSLGEAVITAKTLDGNYTATCKVAVLGKINLLTPSDAPINLHPAVIDKKIAFSWKNIEGIDKYVLKISTTDLFEKESIIYTAESTSNSLDVLEYKLNEAIKGNTGNSVSLFWTVVSGTPGIRVLPEIGHLKLVPDRREYMRLATGSAAGMQAQKMTGEYHYGITVNGNATVNTVALEKNVAVDSGTVVLQYKSNQALPLLTLNLIKSDGTVGGTISQAVAASAEWKELRLQQAELPGGWGKIGDYIQLDFGSVSGYQMELNAINLQKGVYISEILSIVGGNALANILEQRENYVKFKVLLQDGSNPPRTDPVLTTTQFTQDLPARAVLLSFEYKSDQAIAASDAFQIYLGPIAPPYPNVWPSGGVPASSTWKEHIIDMTDVRANNLSWGKKGHFLRLDPGNYSQGMTMEIRNIQIKSKN